MIPISECSNVLYIHDLISNFHDIFNNTLIAQPIPFHSDGEYMRTMEFKFALKK